MIRARHVAVWMAAMAFAACSQQADQSAEPAESAEWAASATTSARPAAGDAGSDPIPDSDAKAFEDLPADVQEKLAALGYVITSDAESDAVGVTIHDPDRAQAGWNLYVSMMGQKATLMDMSGRPLHSWRAPKRDPGDKTRSNVPQWFRTVQVFSNGDLLAQSDFGPLMRLDKNSELLWKFDGRQTHHDMDVAGDGRIYVLTAGKVRPHPEFPLPLGQDFVVELGPDGEVRRRVSILQALVDGGFTEVLDRLREHQRSAEKTAVWDVLHINTVEILAAPEPGLPEGFREGNLLLSCPTISVLLVLDFERARIVWSQKGDFDYQHHPTMLSNGRILLFDNRGAGDERSRILEIDPTTGKSLWAYGEASDREFFTKCCGRVHRLKNGNFLVVVSMEGYAFEVTRDGEIVWEFRIPDRLFGKIPILNDVMRIDPKRLDPSFVSQISGQPAP